MSGLEKRPRRGDRPRENDDFLGWKTAGSFCERIFDFSFLGGLILHFSRNLAKKIENMRKKCLAWKSGLAGAIAREKITIFWLGKPRVFL